VSPRRIASQYWELAAPWIQSTEPSCPRPWQVGLRHDDKQKTAFSTGCGSSPLCSLAASNVPSRFECLMQSVLWGLTKPAWCTWMITSSAWHSRDSWMTCGRCSGGSEGPVRNNPDKCQLFHKIAQCLRHIVTPGRWTDPEKLEPVQRSQQQRQARGKKLPRVMCRQKEVHRWICRHRQAADPTHWREAN
jgi:hypothetical protein